MGGDLSLGCGYSKAEESQVPHAVCYNLRLPISTNARLLDPSLIYAAHVLQPISK